MCVRGGNNCQVDNITRKNCPKCRYDKCVAVGMVPQLVDSNAKRKPSDQQAKGDQQDQTVAAADSNGTDLQSSTQHQIQSRSLLQSQNDISGIKTVATHCRADVATQIDQNLNIHSGSGSDKIDIENLVDDCFTSEFKEKKKLKSNNLAFDTSEDSDMLVLPFKKRPRVEHFEYLSSFANRTHDPVLRFTLEEELCLHDMLARRDKHSEIHFKHFMDVNPMTINSCIEINKEEGKVTYTQEFLDLMLGSAAAEEVGKSVAP